MTTASKVLATAAAEIGYCRWDDPDAGTKYGRWYADYVGSAYYGYSGVPFCAMGVSWVFNELDALDLIPGGAFAYCQYAINAAEKSGQTVATSSGQAGDLIFFDWGADGGDSDHVGLIESVKSGYYVTIEFNTTGSDGRSGSVARKTRAKGSTVCAIVRPNYGSTASSSSSSTASSTASTAKLEVDGYWGTATTKALQELAGTPVDGVVSSQSSYWESKNPGLTSGWEWVSESAAEGSQLIIALQKKLGVTADGLIGTNTIKALQKKLAAGEADGVFDAPSPAIKQLQKNLNAGKLW